MANCKELLRNEIEKRRKDGLRYFSREGLRDLTSAYRPETINRYLVDLGREGIIFGAGRGWYSFVRASFELDRRSVKKIVVILEKKYPLLSFSAWSTEQLKSFAHHMLARFAVFVYADRDAMSGMYDFLKDSGYDVWMNPRGEVARKFNIAERTVVIRPAISRESSSGHFANIEKLLVDLFVESTALNLMDSDEYFRIFGNVLESGRIDIGAMLNYAKRRKLKTEAFIKRIESI